MLTQQCHPDRAKRRGISNNGIRDVSTTVDMTSTHFSVYGSTAILLPKKSVTERFCHRLNIYNGTIVWCPKGKTLAFYCSLPSASCSCAALFCSSRARTTSFICESE